MNEQSDVKKLVIFGAGHATCVGVIDHINRVKPTWSIAGFIDDNPDLQGSTLWGHPVLGDRLLVRELTEDPNVYFYNNVRGHWSRTKAVAELLDSHGCRIATLVHPTVDLDYVELGLGCSISSGCVITGGTKVGEFVSIMANCAVGHDATIEDYAFIAQMSSIGSRCTLRAQCFLGAGAVVVPGTTVGFSGIVGAGAVVTRDVPDGVRVFGVPARPVDGHAKS